MNAFTEKIILLFIPLIISEINSDYTYSQTMKGDTKETKGDWTLCG